MPLEPATELKIKKLLETDNNVELAYLFGSALKEKNRYESDLDIAIYFKEEPTVLEIGALVIRIQESIDIKIDLIALNKLDVLNPALAYAVISEGKIVFCKDEELARKFMKYTILNYFDFKPIIEAFNTAFNKRLDKHEFALSKT